MRALLTTCAGVLLLFCGCRGNDQREWTALSARVQNYTTRNGGQVVRSYERSAPVRWKRWTIVIPTDSIAQERLFELSEGLIAAVSTGSDGLKGTGSGRNDPTIYEQKDGSFNFGSGPAPVWESETSSKDVFVRLVASGLAQATNGLSHFDPIIRASDPPATKLLIQLDLMVMK